jgi:putative FmdB family regulatory protein
MPIYAYRCQECGHSKDVIQKFSDAPLTQCPVCGADAFRKQLTAPAFQLKGSGWYVTDFRDSGKSKSSEAGKPDPAAAASGGQEAGASPSSTDSAAPSAASGAPAAPPAATASTPAGASSTSASGTGKPGPAA